MSDTPDDPLLGPSPDHQAPRLSDGRGDLGHDFAHAAPPESHNLEQSFIAHNRGDVQTLGDEFADPAFAERHRLGESFADPNSLDDTRLGEAFVETNSSGKHRRRRDQAPKKPRNLKPFFVVLVILFIAFLLVFLIGFLPRHRRDEGNAQRAKQEQADLPVVQVVRVERPPAGSPLVVPGTTTPLVEAYLYARANGYLSRRLVDIGDHVRRGQLLAVIDSPDLDQQVDQAREQLRQAQQQLAQQQTQLALTRITNDRYRVLVAKGVFSRQDGDQQATNFNAQVANVAAAERNVEAFRANLGRVIALQSYERVTSPFDGVVTQRNVDVGALISAAGAGSGAQATSAPPTGGTVTQSAANTGGTTGSPPTAATPMNSGNNGGPLFSIAQVDRLRILVSVPEGYAGSVHRGQHADLHFQELPNSVFSGIVTRTADSIDQNTRTMLTEIQVDNHDGRLLNGMYAVASFAPAIAGAGPITISGDAIAVRNSRNVVGLVRGDIVHIQQVELGRDFGALVEINSGLKVGDLIASTVTDEIREGARVKVQLTQPKGAASPKAPNPADNGQNTPPGGSTQYGNQSVTDRNMQGVGAGGQKKQGQPPASSKGDSKQ